MTACIPGKYVDKLEQTVCVDCASGRYSAEVARKKECVKCQIGQSQKYPGRLACLGAFIHFFMDYYYFKQKDGPIFLIIVLFSFFFYLNLLL